MDNTGTECTPLLFVDDDPSIRRTFARTMEHHGFSVDVAASAEEAIQQTRRRRYRIILTDLRMPGLDGMSLVRRLGPSCPDTLFIIVTGAPEIDLLRDGVTDRAIVSVVSKPWDSDALVELVQRTLKLQQRRVHRVSESPSSSKKSRECLLLVEDDDIDAEILETYIRMTQFRELEIVHATRLEDAISLAQEKSILVAIADLSLPDAQGLDSIARLRVALPDAALIVLTGLDDEDMALQAIQMGAQDFHQKGQLDARILERSIRYAIERKRAERRLVHLAHFDQLTGLANRSTFRERLTHTIARSRRSQTPFAVMFVDLDRFKRINDTMGHHAGDELLTIVARRLRDATRDYDMVARLGGDEFAVLLEAPVADFQQIAERAADALRQPMHIAGEDIVVTASIGLSTFPDSGQTTGELLEAADVAMYRAKERGGDTYTVSGAAEVRAVVELGAVETDRLDSIPCDDTLTRLRTDGGSVVETRRMKDDLENGNDTGT